MTIRSIQYLHLLLIVCWFASAVALWPTLPEAVPMHFDGSGAPDAWAEKSLFSWFGLPFIGLLLALLTYGLSRIGAGSGSMDLWNVPEKERFLRLTPEQRAPMLERLRRIPLTCGLFTTVVLASVHVGVYQVATGRSVGLPWYCMLTIGIAIALILIMSVREALKFGEDVRRQSSG